MIRVLHLRSGSGLYGADRALLALASATRPPFQPVVGSLIREGLPDALSAEARRQGLEALCFRSRGRADFGIVRELVREARAKELALLHAHDFKALWVALLAGLVAGVPVVATFHGETRVTLRVRAYELLARLLANFTHGVAAVSRPLHRTLSRWVRLTRVAVVPNALPLREAPSPDERASARAALGLAPDAWVVAVIGRLSPEKGHAVLLDALREMRERPTVLFAGDGPLRAQLEARAHGLPVRFLGYVDEPRAIYAAADVVCLPSLTEGLPLVALEALAASRCVIASEVGELPDLLRDGAGILVPPGSALALGLALEAAAHAPTRERVAAAGAARVRSFDVHAMAGEYARLYRGALPSSAGVLASSSR